MASGILITAVLIFAVRGMFLGFSGVIGRVLGIILGYYMAYSYREPVADILVAKTNLSLPAIVFQMLAGMGLFISTLIITGLLVTIVFKLLGNTIPFLNALTDKKSTGGKITGAAVNAMLGAIIVFMGIWAYGKAKPNPNEQDPLHIFANRFGDTVFSVVKENADIDLESFTKTSSYSSYTTSSASGKKSFSKGTATISSASNPNKTLSIESVRKIIEQNQEQLGNIDPTALLNNEQLQQLLNNSDIRDMAMEQLQNNPEQIQQVLDKPQLKALLEQLSDK